MTLLNESGECSVYWEIAKPFQLLEDRIVFIDNGNLFQRTFSDSHNQRIAENVSRFVALEDSVLFLSGSTLFVYRWDLNAERLMDDICFFFIHRDQIYVVKQNGQVMRLEENGSWQVLCLLEIESYPFYVMPQGDFIISQKANELQYVNIYTGVAEVIYLARSDYANNRIHFIFLCKTKTHKKTKVK